MELFYTKRSPYARKVRILIIEKKIGLDLIEEDLTKKTNQLLQANPLGKIPALVLDNGETFVDSPVICKYLDSLNDNPVLIPRSGLEHFRALHLEAIADGLMDVSVGLYMEKIRHPKDFNEAFIQAQQKTIEQTLSLIEKNTALYKELSIAAIATAAAIGYLNFRLGELNPKGQYPKLQNWFEEFSKRPSMTKTLPTN